MLPARAARESGRARTSRQARCEVDVQPSKRPRITDCGWPWIPEDCPSFEFCKENVYPARFPFKFDCLWPDEDACEQNASANIECMDCREDCPNMRLQRGQWPECIVRKTQERGFGYFAPEKGIPKNTPIGPYTGEVFHASQLTDSRKQVYIMQIDKKLYVDAKKKGHFTRFINHACTEFNCEVQKWYVRGYPCVGVFALRDIAPGEELTFDYGVKFKDDKTFVCNCATCRPPAPARSHP
jgi:hypothetical protein